MSCMKNVCVFVCPCVALGLAGPSAEAERYSERRKMICLNPDEPSNSTEPQTPNMGQEAFMKFLQTPSLKKIISALLLLVVATAGIPDC